MECYLNMLILVIYRPLVWKELLPLLGDLHASGMSDFRIRSCGIVGEWSHYLASNGVLELMKFHAYEIQFVGLKCLLIPGEGMRWGWEFKLVVNLEAVWSNYSKREACAHWHHPAWALRLLEPWQGRIQLFDRKKYPAFLVLFCLFDRKTCWCGEVFDGQEERGRRCVSDCQDC